MKQFFSILMGLTISLSALAMTAETIAVDTLEFSTENLLPEPNPNEGYYVLTMYSPDNEWKIQIRYFSDSQFGTFTDDDFDLSGSGRNYCYMRKPSNDMVFYSFSHIDATITSENGMKVELNATYDLYGKIHRVLVHGMLPAPQIKDTTTLYMEHAYVTRNTQFEYYLVEAENEDYTLRFGFLADEITTDTFYIADLLKPELTLKSTGVTMGLCVVCDQMLYVSAGQNFNTYRLDIISDDYHFYSITMDDDWRSIAIQDSIEIICSSTMLYDFTMDYGMYQLVGYSDEYGVALAVLPEAIEQSYTTFAPTDFAYDKSGIARLSDTATVVPAYLDATLVPVAEGCWLFDANFVGRDANYYHIQMPVGYTIESLGDTTDERFPVRKLIRDGKLLIVVDDKQYNILGVSY